MLISISCEPAPGPDRRGRHEGADHGGEAAAPGGAGQGHHKTEGEGAKAIEIQAGRREERKVVLRFSLSPKYKYFI